MLLSSNVLLRPKAENSGEIQFTATTTNTGKETLALVNDPSGRASRQAMRRLFLNSKGKYISVWQRK